MTASIGPRAVRIAVIDSGVHPTHDHIDASRLLPGVAIGGDGQVDDGADATLDRLGHGTAVLAAIQEKAPEAECIPVRVFREGLKTTGLALIAAVDWAVEAGADLINLSLGSTNPAHAASFAAAAERATRRGTILVAPREVNGTACYPGALPGVLAVGLDWDCPRESYRCSDDPAGTLLASGYPRPIPGVPPRRNLYGISFATAQVTGFAAHAMADLYREGSGHADLASLRAAMHRPA